MLTKKKKNSFYCHSTVTLQQFTFKSRNMSGQIPKPKDWLSWCRILWELPTVPAGRGEVEPGQWKESEAGELWVRGPEPII